MGLGGLWEHFYCLMDFNETIYEDRDVRIWIITSQAVASHHKIQKLNQC